MIKVLAGKYKGRKLNNFNINHVRPTQARVKKSIMDTLMPFENKTILQTGNIIKSLIPSKINITKSNDPRSYRQDSSKLISTGFIPKFTITDAITDLKNRYENGQLKIDDINHNVKWMKHINL